MGENRFVNPISTRNRVLQFSALSVATEPLLVDSMLERSPVSQALTAVLISVVVLLTVGATVWFVEFVDDALGHGPLPSGLDLRNGYILTIATALLGIAAGGVMIVGVRQAKYFTPQFAWLVYVIVLAPLLLVLLVPLQRFEREVVAGLPLFLMGTAGRSVVAVAFGALLLGALDLRRILPRMVHESARPVARVPGTTPVHGLPGRFTPNAWRSLSFMQEEAQRFDHAYMGTEHLLLGLLRDPGSQASRVVVNLGGELASIKSQLEGVIGRRGSLFTGTSGLTRRCQRVIEGASRVARTAGERTVSTGHLLYALVEQPEDVTAQMLESTGVTAERVSSELRHLGPETEERSG